MGGSPAVRPQANGGASGQGVCGVLRRIWFLALLSGSFHVFAVLEIHVYLPYLYTRVRCCGPGEELDSQYDITDPEQLAAMVAEAHAVGLEVPRTQPPGGGEALRACSVPAFPPSSRLWSLSPGCVSRAYVQDSAQALEGQVQPLQKLVGLLMLPVGGAVADGVGRRPVLACYGLCCLVASLVSALDAQMHAFIGDLAVYLAGLLLCASFQPKDTIFSGAVADIVGQREVDKAQAFAGLSTLAAVATLICNLASYACVRSHMTSYTAPWLSFALLAALMLLLLQLLVPETLPGHLRKPLSSDMLDPLRTQQEGLRLLARDPLLVQLGLACFLFWAYFLGFVTTKVSYLISVGYAVEDTILPEIVASVAQILFAGAALKLIPAMGAWWSCTLAHAIFFLSYVFWGPYTLLLGGLGPYVANTCQSAGFIILLPSLQTIVSQRVESCHQSKCQAALAAIGTVGGMLGVPFYNRVLFSATAQGIERARTPLVSMAFAFVCCMLSLHLAATAARTKPATALQQDPAAEPMTAPELELADGPKRPEHPPFQAGYL